MMENKDLLMNLCRLCLESNQPQVPIFKEGKADTSDLFDKISVCLPINLSETDGFPKKICNTCYKSVEFVYNFWHLTSNTEKQLHNMLENVKEIQNELNVPQDTEIEENNENTVILYDTLDVENIIREDKDLEINNENNIEIKEVYFEYLNQSEFIEDNETAFEFKESNSTSEMITDTSVQSSNDNSSAIIQNDIDDVQISQIVESSNVSLRTYEDMNTLKVKMWNINLPDFILIPHNYDLGKQTVTNSNNDDLVNVQKVEMTNELYVCNICQAVFREQLPLLKHYENVHKRHKCPFCIKCFSSLYGLENHLYVHSTLKNFSCSLCSAKFKRKPDLQRHIKKTHYTSSIDTQIFECEHCSYQTKYKKSMQIHVLNHLGISLFSCDLCGQGFNNKLDFITHQRNHLGFKQYQCDICCSRFTRKHYMLKHRKTVHEELYSYQCDVCGRNFSFENSLNAHLRLHSGENCVQCNICGKKVSSKVSLINHQKIHSNEREFVCGICGKMYINKYSLQEHVLVHTGSKPFQCMHCDKSFSTRKKLLNHEQIHDISRISYLCTQCDKSYFSKYKLNEHVRKNH